jgi:hypothetical protein
MDKPQHCPLCGEREDCCLITDDQFGAAWEVTCSRYHVTVRISVDVATRHTLLNTPGDY